MSEFINYLLFISILTSFLDILAHKCKGRQNEPSSKNLIIAHILIYKKIIIKKTFLKIYLEDTDMKDVHIKKLQASYFIPVLKEKSLALLG